MNEDRTTKIERYSVGNGEDRIQFEYFYEMIKRIYFFKGFCMSCQWHRSAAWRVITKTSCLHFIGQVYKTIRFFFYQTVLCVHVWTTLSFIDACDMAVG